MTIFFRSTQLVTYIFVLYVIFMGHVYTLSLFIFLAASCSTIKVSDRKGKDISINSTNSQRLNGKYLNKSFDTTSYRRLLWQEIDDKTKYNEDFEKAIVKVATVNDTQLEMTLLLNDSLVNKIRLKGVYKKGYFNIKRQLDASFKYGPLWTLGDKKMCIGLSKENNLVLLTSSSNTALLILFPIGGAGDKNILSCFQRID